MNHRPLLALLAIGFCLLVCPLGRAAIDPELRAAVANRTVLVYNPFFGDFNSTTGFVWGYRDKVSYVLTAVGSEMTVRELPEARIIIFPGTKREKECKGRIVLYDRVLRLAVIAVKEPALPPPFALATSPVKTGAPLCVGTCPRPEIEGARVTHKRATVASSSLGATRTSKRLDLLQLNGTIPEGGEGGPVVQADGKLVGIARAQLGITLIGVAVPISYTERFFSGMPGVPMAGQYRKVLECETVAVSVPLLDLGGKVQACSLHVVPKADVPAPVAPEDGDWQLLHRDMTTIEIPVAHPMCAWERPTAECGLLLGEYWVQARTTVRGGGQFVSPPAELQIRAPFKPVTFTAKPVPKPEPKPVPEVQAKPIPKIPDINEVRFAQSPLVDPLRAKKAFTQHLGAYDLTPFQIGSDRNGEFHEAQKALSADALWAEDGNALYVCHGMNITRIAFPAGTETARALAGEQVRLRLARQGLVAVVHNQGLVLLDPETLALRKRLSVPGMADLLVAPQGRYAIGISGSPSPVHPYEPFSASDEEKPIGALHIIDLDAWSQVRVYRSRGTPLPVVPAHAELVDQAMATPAALTHDGSHFVVAGYHGSGRMTVVYPFRDGRLVAPGVDAIPGQVAGLVPQPNSATVLVVFPRREWGPGFPRPEGAPARGSGSVQALDTTDPGAKAKRHWAGKAGVTRDRLFLYAGQEDGLQVLASDGTECPPVPLPRVGGAAPLGLRAILPAPAGNRTILLGANTAYLLETASGPPGQAPGAAPAALATDKAKPPKADTATGTPLAATVRVIGGMQCRYVQTHPKQAAPQLRTNAAGDTAYLVSQAGLLTRIDLDAMVETHRVEEKGTTTGLCVTRAGVVTAVANEGAAELRLRDPDDLQILARWPLPGTVSNLISRPTTDAILMDDQKGNLILFDGANGRVAQSYGQLPLPAGTPPPPRTDGYPAPVISKDGTLVFAVQNQRLLRLRIENGALVPEAVSIEPVGRAKCVAVDEDAQYVGLVTLDFSDTLRGNGWGPRLRALPSAEKKARNGIVVFDASSLVPLYQADLPGVSRFGFDSEQSQLVTDRGTRCFPDGTLVHAEGQAGTGSISRLGGPLPPLERSRDGWFIRGEADGFCRFRFPAMAVPTRSLAK